MAQMYYMMIDIKKHHIGLFATNLINAVRWTDACPSSKKYIYAQSATAYGKIHVILQRGTKQQSHRTLCCQQTPPAEYQEKGGKKGSKDKELKDTMTLFQMS